MPAFASSIPASAMAAVVICGGRAGGGPSFGPGPDMAQVGPCRNIYRPVCTQLGALPRTFPNACEAERRGYPIIGPGPC